MTVQITIVGLGQIGASVGLALANQQNQLLRVGHDLEVQIARRAEKMGALDRVDLNLPHAVRGADLVLLALPLDQIRPTLEIIASDLKEGAVVMDTAPVKDVVLGWADELIPAGRYYIGLTPVLNPEYLHENAAGLEAAHADLFQDGLMAIVAPSKTNSEAIKLAADLTALLGATPFFIDSLELDGLMASTHLLPQFVAAALVGATMDQPGWQEGRKVAGRAYAEATAPTVHLDDVEALREAALHNRENVLRLLGNAITALEAIRKDIEARDGKALDDRLGQARKGRVRWWQERMAAEWMTANAPEIEIPENPGLLGRLFGIGHRPKQNRR
ncbi:MAG: prephenate dehydrogenase [Anaerolineales bacterium]|nr:prephenate dehydrogenase [Anaerolineales bacterium]